MSDQLKTLTSKFEQEKKAQQGLEKKLKAEEQEFHRKELASEQRIRNTMANLEKEKAREFEANQLSKSQIQKDSSTINELQSRLSGLSTKESKEVSKLNEITKLEQLEAKKEKQMEKKVLQLQLAQSKDDKEKEALAKRISELGKQITEHDKVIEDKEKALTLTKEELQK